MLSFVLRARRPRQLTCIGLSQLVNSSHRDGRYSFNHPLLLSTNRMVNKTSGVVASIASAYQTIFNAPGTLPEPLEFLDATTCQTSSPEPNMSPKRIGDNNVIIVPLDAAAYQMTSAEPERLSEPIGDKNVHSNEKLRIFATQ
jgi:hypothetical protein